MPDNPDSRPGQISSMVMQACDPGPKEAHV